MLAIPHGVELYLSCNRATQLPHIYARKRKTYVHTVLYLNVYSSSIHNPPKLGTTKTSFNWYRDNLQKAHTTNYYSVMKRNARKNMDESQTYIY